MVEKRAMIKYQPVLPPEYNVLFQANLIANKKITKDITKAEKHAAGCGCLQCKGYAKRLREFYNL